MYNVDEILNKKINEMTLVFLKDKSLKECVSNLQDEGFNTLYNFYNIMNEDIKTKKEK